MEIGHHRADVPRRVLAAQLAGPQPRQVFLHRRRKAGRIGFVHRIVLALLGHADVLVAQHVRPHGRIQREPVHAVACRVDQDRRRTVDHIARGNLLAARLQHPFFHIRRVLPRGPPQDRKRRSDADPDVDIGRAVQGIEHDRIIGVRRAEIDNHRMLVFLRRQQADALPQAQAMQQDLVGIDIQFLLRLALDVRAAVRAQQIAQSGAADLSLDQLCRQRDTGQQPRELAGRPREPPLLLQDMLLDGHDRPVVQSRQGLPERLACFRFQRVGVGVAHVGCSLGG